MKIRILAVSLLLISCATANDGWNEKGFVVTPAGARTWWVSYEGQPMGRQSAKDHLLYHSARLVLEKGGAYFTFEESRSAAEPIERSTTASDRPAPTEPESNRPIMEYPHGDNAPAAMVEIVNHSAPGALDASKVIEELNQKYPNRVRGE